MDLSKINPNIDVVAFESFRKTYETGAQLFSSGAQADLRSVSSGAAPKLESLTNNPYRFFGPDQEVHNPDSIDLSDYRRMDADPTLKIGKLLLMGLMSSLKYTIKCSDDEVQFIVNHIYDRHHNSILRNVINTALRDGFCFAEKVWMKRQVELYRDLENGEEELVYSGTILDLKKVKFLDPENSFDFYVNRQDELVRVEQKGWVSNKKLEVSVKRKKLFWFALDEEFSNIFGRSRYKAGYYSSYFDKIIYQLKFKHLEKVGSPAVKGRFPQGFTTINGVRMENGDLMQMIAEHFVSTGQVSLPSVRDPDSKEYLWDIGFLEVQNAEIQHYIDALAYSKSEKLNALGVFSSIVMDNSNFSEVDAKAEIQQLMLEPTIDQIEEAIKRDIIDYIVDQNFGPEMIDKVHFRIERAGLGQKRAIKELLDNFMRLSMSREGQRPKYVYNIRQLASELNIDLVEYEDFFEVDGLAEEVEEKKTERASEVQKDKAAEPPGQTPEQKKRRDEDSNTPRRRAKPDTRQRERPSATKSVT